MGAGHAQQGAFEKVGECLYRYSSNGIYYAVLRHSGKLIRRSLETTDKVLARRKLADFRRDIGRMDPSAGRVALSTLSQRYLATCTNQAAKTLRRKQDIVARIKQDWPGGWDVAVTKVKPSDVATWLAGYDFGWASQHLYLECLRAIFDMAVADKIIVENPARSSTIKRKKKERPMRLTPTYEEFQQMVSDIRSQGHNADAKESADFIEFLGLAGLGQAEASALRWCDIDWTAEQVSSFRVKTRTRFYFPLYPQLRPLLERRKSGCEAEPEQLVFGIKDAKKSLAASCKRLKLPAYSQRALRRMFVTRAIQKGVDAKTISEWQGHQDGGKLIFDTYSHVFATHSNRMATLLK
jgi:integrase